MSQSPDDPPPLIPRYRLRTLFLLIAVVVVFLSWISNRGHRQGRLTAELSKMDAEWYYSFQHPRTHGMRPWCPYTSQMLARSHSWTDDFLRDIVVVNIYTYGNFGDPATDDTLARIVAVRSIKALDVMSPEITDRGLAYLTRLPRLRSLALHSRGITDEGVKTLTAMGELRELWIASPSITDQGLAHLASMQNLEVLHIRGPKITDAGLATLAHSKNLIQLGLWGTQITDRGLSILEDLPTLTQLTIADTPITGACLAHMKRLEWIELYNTGITQTALDRANRYATCVVQPAAPIPPFSATWGNLPPVKALDPIDNASRSQP